MEYLAKDIVEKGDRNISQSPGVAGTLSALPVVVVVVVLKITGSTAVEK